jgi:hypothetical protein
VSPRRRRSHRSRRRSSEFFADLVYELKDGDGGSSLAVVIEVQLGVKDDKLRTWPVYLATVRSRRCCRTCVLVIAPDPAVAAWAAAPIDLGPGNEAFRVLVLGPAQVPVVTEEEQAREAPELALLSALVHGNDEGVGEKVLAAAFTGLGAFDTKAAEVYLYIVWKFLRGPMRAALEEMVREAEAKGELTWPPFMQRLRDEGEARGEARGKADGILTILSVRGLAVSEEVRERVLACRDLEQLDAWLRKAATATTLPEVFG